MVYFYGKPAGILTRMQHSYIYQYLPEYLKSDTGPISFSLPLQEEPFESKHLHAYFSGLCSEGWLRKIQCREQRIDSKDEFTLLINNGKDLAGAVTIEPF